MKVIVASYSKTGTKSLVVALNELGYNVYDFFDHFWYHGKEWERILTSGGTVEDFKRMYKDVDAVTDCPTFIFWEEILQAFPDAKVILTLRDEKSWHKSVVGQANHIRQSLTYKLMQVLSPTGWKYFKFFQNTVKVGCGHHMKHPFHLQFGDNEMLLRRFFRQHNQYCQQNCPRDKLLIFNLKDGWEPLCKFLGNEIPDTEFPHENVGGNVLAKLMATHPATIRIQREMIVSLCLILGLGVFGSYAFYRKGCFQTIISILPRFK